MWLELQDSSGIRHALPDGAKLTLLSGNRYYLYTLTGGEKDGKIPLDNFAEMWGSSRFNENIAAKTITVIAAFDKTASLMPGEYSLRLRNDTGADSVGGYFTVNNSTAAITLDSQEGLARGEHRISIFDLPSRIHVYQTKRQWCSQRRRVRRFPRGLRLSTEKNAATLLTAGYI